jgi:transposase
MISFSGSLKIFLLVDCCDMRKGFNGLYGLVSSSFGEDPRSGALYVFCNRRQSRIKVLYFDGYVTFAIMGQMLCRTCLVQKRARDQVPY